MAMIYRHSTLTIAASGARSADEGCFLSRNPIPKVQLPYYTREGNQASHVHVSNSADMPIMHGDVVNGPLAHRAWTLQECLLSRRVLFYGKGSLRWSCNQRQCSETREETDKILWAWCCREWGRTVRGTGRDMGKGSKGRCIGGLGLPS